MSDPIDKLSMPQVRAVHRSKTGHSCPLWVTSRQSVLLGLCPLYPRKRTESGHLGMSALCQLRLNAPQQKALLLDHLVGEREQIVGDIEAKRLGGG